MRTAGHGGGDHSRGSGQALTAARLCAAEAREPTTAHGAEHIRRRGELARVVATCLGRHGYDLAGLCPLDGPQVRDGPPLSLMTAIKEPRCFGSISPRGR